ncbi:hypothetical protein [Algoriphagus aquimarinus]|uniref:Transporter n=1 Tax=Algoriphagus aquimarinus TaxID=237018 RepID=A0A5C7AQ74_9BACT|nr:hypothetical protein [Algoriphagus aquimarinus]TXE08002.1 hypothetical protein ESV85_14880 [Algoriphagus aquimarinus]
MKSTYYKIILLSLVCFSCLGIQKSYACDSCNFFEYSLLQNKSYLGVFYRYRAFNDYKSYSSISTAAQSVLTYPQQLSTNLLPGNYPIIMHEPEGNNLYVKKSKEDFETYQTIEVRGNFTIKNKWNFTAVLPYEFNKVYYEEYLDLPNPSRDTTLFVQGWGDLTLAGDYILMVYNQKSRHTIRLGIAINLPTGQALIQSDNENHDYYDPIIQPGKKALAIIPRLNYQWFLNNQGINAGASYQFSTEGAQNYQAGKSFNAYAIYFHQVQASDKVLLAPNAGLYYEASEKDLWNDVKQNLTGGKVAFAQIGLDFNITQTTLNLVYQHPIWQDLNGNQIQHASRINVGIIRNFKL